jgi:predicted Zn-dependent peptidase
MKHTVSEITLKNGAKGLLIHIPDASVMTYEFNFRAGEYLVDEEKWETPHLMEHTLLGANKQYPKARLFQAEIERNGAYSNASTGVYDISYDAECADFEWDRILRLMLIAITTPLFLDDEFKAEFGNVREELAARGNNHFRHLSLALREKYGFIAKTDQERLKLMQHVTVDDVRKHYKKTHTTRNLRFVIAGNITPKRHEQILSELEQFALPLGTSRLALPDERPQGLGDKPLYIRNKTVDTVYFYADSFMQRRMSDDESDALALVNTMLTETLYSKILGTARERGLVYGMSSGYGQSKLSSNWWFGAQVSQENAAALFDIIVTEVKNVFDGKLATDDVEAAKAYSLGRFQRSAQTVGGTAGGYSRYFFDEIIEDYYQVPKRIKAIDKSTMIEISRALFQERLWGLGVLSNCDKPFANELQERLAPLWNITTP